jgi:RNA polymerase sigma factor (sigma-70 family)
MQERALPFAAGPGDELHSACLDGQTWALEALHELCCRLAARDCRKHELPRQDAEDLGLDFFLFLVDPQHQRLRHYRGEGYFYPWLVLCLQHFLSHEARSRRRRPAQTAGLELAARAADPAADVEAQALTDLEMQASDALVRRAVALLTPEERRLFSEHDVEGRSYEELARERRVPVGRLRRRHSRVCCKLRQIIARLGVPFPPDRALPS